MLDFNENFILMMCLLSVLGKKDQEQRRCKKISRGQEAEGKSDCFESSISGKREQQTQSGARTIRVPQFKVED